LPRRAKGTPSAQTPDQLAFERATALDVQRLIDRLMADAHGLIIREVDPEPVRDLLRAPRQGPRPVLAVRLVAPGELDRPGKGGGLDLPRRMDSCLHRGSIPMSCA